MSHRLIGTVLVIALSLLVSGCGGLRGKNIVYLGDTKYPPNPGKVQVFWKEHGTPPKPYELIGTVSGMPFWAGVHDGRTYKPLHDYIKTTAGEMGGDAVIIYCGEYGTIAQGKCYGDVVKLK